MSDKVRGYRKYELLQEGRDLFRIKALIDIPKHEVKAGDYGGLVQFVDSLSHLGDCWVRSDAKVLDEGYVYGNSLLTDQAVVKNTAQISGDAIVGGNSLIFGAASVGGVATVMGNARIGGNAFISGECLILGKTYVIGHAKVSGTAWLDNDIMIRGELTE